MLMPLSLPFTSVSFTVKTRRKTKSECYVRTNAAILPAVLNINRLK